MEEKKARAQMGGHGGLPDFVLLFNQIGHYLKNPQGCTPVDQKIAQDAFDTITEVIYGGSGRCTMNPPTIQPL